MNEIRLDGAAWRTADDFYDAVLRALRAPAWHSRNLDALNDTLAGDDINEVRQPLRFTVSGINEMPTDLRNLIENFRDLIVELRVEGHDVEITYLPPVV
ncbi:MAG TPA: barstar family protein [Thermoanaerobaculia bacterium]